MDAMQQAIVDTTSSVMGSSLTTIAGFLVLCTMNLTLGKDLGLVMAKGVFLGVISVLTIFPSLILISDKLINKTKHKPFTIHFEKLNKFVIKHHVGIFALFVILIIPAYLANSKVGVYYKIDESLPDTLDSIVANTELKDKFNIVSPEIILIDKDMKSDDVNKMVDEIRGVDGIDLVLSFSKLKSMGLTEDMLPSGLVKVFESDECSASFSVKLEFEAGLLILLIPNTLIAVIDSCVGCGTIENSDSSFSLNPVCFEVNSSALVLSSPSKTLALIPRLELFTRLASLFNVSLLVSPRFTLN